MIRQFSHYAQIGLALIAMSCLLTTMIVFMGGQRGGADFTALLLLQLAAIPVSLCLVAAGFVSVASSGSWRTALHTLWHALPQWLLFMFFFLNSLFVMGEIALHITSQMTAAKLSWQAHIPLACMLASSLAFLVLYAAARSGPGVDRALSGRWSQE